MPVSTCGISWSFFLRPIASQYSPVCTVHTLEKQFQRTFSETQITSSTDFQVDDWVHSIRWIVCKIHKNILYVIKFPMHQLSHNLQWWLRTPWINRFLFDSGRISYGIYRQWSTPTPNVTSSNPRVAEPFYGSRGLLSSNRSSSSYLTYRIPMCCCTKRRFSAMVAWCLCAALYRPWNYAPFTTMRLDQCDNRY